MWRTDLEGLRVVAILLVAFYHVWFGRVSGGVDVFLMLSGFFVGGSLWRAYSSGKPPKLLPYLGKHARRLLPAAVVVLAATAVAVVIVLPRTRWVDGSWQSLASLAYVQNWYLIGQGDAYGAADVNQSPWQHFWSLSVQGQLFVTLPLALALIALLLRQVSSRLRTPLLAAFLIVVGVGSFVLAMIMVRDDQSVAYFHSLTRVWEFLLGMGLAGLLAKWRPAGGWWQLASWLGLASLLATGLYIDGRATFPGPLTLVPVGAAAILVVAGSAGGRFGVNQLLALRPVAAMGKYAYAFYLWHWPILILITAFRGRPSGWKVGIAILVLSAVLAALTYHLVEKPLRNPKPRVTADSPTSDHIPPRALMSRRLALAGVGMFSMIAVLAPVGWVTYVDQRASLTAELEADTHQYPGARAILDPTDFADFPELDPIPVLEAAHIDRSTLANDGCIATTTQSDLVDCEYVGGDSLRVALFGGSHSVHWFDVALDLAEENSWTLVPIVKNGCPPTVPEAAKSDSCRDWLVKAYDEMASGEFDLIITTGTRPDGFGNDIIPDDYIGMLESLSAHSHVLAIRDNPSFPDVLMPECWAVEPNCDVGLYERISEQNPADDFAFENVTWVDTNDIVCPDDLCRPVIGNIFVFRDGSHLTAEFVRSAAPAFAERWVRALQIDGVLPAVG